MLVLLHGPNDLEREEALGQWLHKAGPPDLVRLNTETLEPPLPPGALWQAGGAIPFLADVRVVVVRNALSGKSAERGTKEILETIPRLPSTTWLIFVEGALVPEKHPLQRVEGLKAQAFPLPDLKSLPDWIQKRARHHGTTIQPAAVALLAQALGPDLRLLDQEIQKILTYRGDAGPITAEDVQTLVTYVTSANVMFDLVDAVGQRQAPTASRHLHRLLETGENPLGIFGMVVRQFRLLMQVRWLADRHNAESEIAQQLRLHPFVAKKVRAQSTYFTPEQLRQAYQLLLEADLAIKRGALSAEAALDLLVAQLTRL